MLTVSAGSPVERETDHSLVDCSQSLFGQILDRSLILFVFSFIFFQHTAYIEMESFCFIRIFAYFDKVVVRFNEDIFVSFIPDQLSLQLFGMRKAIELKTRVPE